MIGGIEPSPEQVSLVVELTEYPFKRQLKSANYANVYLAQHEHSKRWCIVKQLGLRKLEGKHKKSFDREIQISTKVKSPFIVEFVGFSIRAPPSLLYEYVPNGNLHTYLYKRGLEITGTEKTVIAIGIAYAMRVLHDHGIVHGDLTTWSVLLDERMAPKIALSRASHNIGDEFQLLGQNRPNYAAPEKLSLTSTRRESDVRATRSEVHMKGREPDPRAKENDPDLKGDVFSYGILLWELFTGIRPFHNMTSGQIRAFWDQKQTLDVKDDGGKPALAKLIAKCMRRDPRTRPAFSKIVEKLRGSGLRFPGADEQVIRRFIDACDREERFIWKPEESVYNTFMYSLQNDLTVQDPEAREQLLLVPENRKAFMRAAVSVLQSDDRIEVHKNAALELIAILARGAAFVDEFVDMGLHNQLTFDTKEVLDHVLSILIPVFDARPDAGTVELVEKIEKLWTVTPVKVLRLMGVICNGTSEENFCWHAADSILCHAKPFIDRDILFEYVQVLYFLLVRFACFRNERRHPCIAIFRRCVDSIYENVVQAGYIMLTSLHQPEVNQPELIVKHFQSDKLRPAVLRYLSVVNVETVDTSIIPLLKLSNERMLVSAVLWRFAECSRFVPAILADVDLLSIRPCDLSRLLLLMLCDVKNRPLISHFELLPEVLKTITSTGDPSLLQAVSVIIRRLEISPTIVRRFEESNFLSMYFEKVMLVGNNDRARQECLIRHAYLVIDQLIRKEYVPSFGDFLPRIVTDLSGNAQFQKASMSLLYWYFQSEGGREALKDHDIASILDQIQIQPGNGRLGASLKNVVSELGCSSPTRFS